jgi:hypothetical protein
MLALKFGGMDAVGERFGTGRLHGSETIGQHGGKHLHHLAIAVVRALQLASNTLQAGRQQPVFERGAIAQRAGLPGELFLDCPEPTARPFTSSGISSAS